MQKVAEFLLYADRCERLADAMGDAASCHGMRETAKQWRSMAEQRQLLLEVPAYRMISSRTDDPLSEKQVGGPSRMPERSKRGLGA
ncbi:hypothetical protein AC630_31840 [Bradyrhizobium sp. AS23.2]|nr:hypothetical protein AC630_31840 [Bradyrhizobium sp. AS23.2]